VIERPSAGRVLVPDRQFLLYEQETARIVGIDLIASAFSGWRTFQARNT
jgi:hypothetical protein